MLKSGYYTNGHLSEIKLDGQTSIWKLQKENVRGLTTKVLTGDVTRTYTYDTDGLPTGRSAARAGVTVFAQGYSFDAETGNLEERTDEMRGLAELFTYDHLNRLTGWQVLQDGTRTATHRMAYGANGNLTYLDGAGTLEYAHPQKPYAVTGVYAATSETSMSGFEHAIEYTSFYRPASITSDTLVTEFTYNAGGERVKMASLSESGNITARYYLGGVYEADTRTNTEYLYLGGDAYSAPAVYVRQGNTWQVYYIIRDYLGSICAITGSGGLVAEYSYDPWGNLRDPETQEAYAPGEEPELFLGHGFTGHEHLTAYGLINMNARLYDPMTGRFLSPDPYVQSPDFSQAFNRFGYCWNNPLRYVDEDGEFIITALIIGAAIGAALGAVSGYKIGKAKGATGKEMAGYVFGGLAIGAIGGGAAGAVGAAVGAAVGIGGFLGGAATGATAGLTGGFINGAGMSWLGGSSFGKGLVDGAIGGGIGAVVGGLVGGLTQGFTDLAKGKGFWDGFDYQGTLDRIVAQEGIKNPDSEFLVANRRNAKVVNEKFGANTTKVRGNKIFMNENSYSELGANFGTKGKGNITLISKQAIRNRGDFVLLDVLRHEGTHQTQILSGMTNIRQMEIKAYMTNILNPATSTTIQKVSSILINDWNVEAEMLRSFILEYYPNYY